MEPVRKGGIMVDNDTSRSFGKVFRDKAKSGREQVGHGVEGLRGRASRQAGINADPGGHIDPAHVSNSGTVRDDGIGNTSETGVGTPETGGPDPTNPTAPRSPLSPGMGCSRPAGTMFIASMGLTIAALRIFRR
jgi:hypothetical protein